MLEEAEDPTNPLLERVKFLSIFSSNLDEFFMVRVAGLREQAFGNGAPQDYSPDGLRPITQLQRIAVRTQELVAAQYRCWNESVLPGACRPGLPTVEARRAELRTADTLDRFFLERAFPILTPMAVDPAHPSPRYHNRSLYLAAMLERHSGLGPKQLFAVVQLPQVLPRLVPLGQGDDLHFILLEEAVAARLPELFGGFDVLSSTTFRITRDSDIELLEQESDDMLRLIEERLKAAAGRGRAAGSGRRRQRRTDSHDRRARRSKKRDGTADSYNEVYHIPGPLDLTALMELVQVPNRDYCATRRFAPAAARPRPRGRRAVHGRFAATTSCCTIRSIRFDPVVDFVNRAARRSARCWPSSRRCIAPAATRRSRGP